ncbi:MAG: DUF4388 domain-containing protein [Acidobacteriota bacterium]|nr:MAG: DUF4388 domain-containing protein [Acidobacteriota bacterium]
MRQVVLQGNLQSLVLPDVLGFISAIKKTGELVFRRGSVTKTIYWENGEITFAASSDAEDALGSFLVRNGMISQTDNLRSVSQVTAERRQGKILVQMGLLKPRELWWAVKNQVLEIVYSIFTWEDGEFEFIETDEVRGERISLDASTMNIVLEGVRRMDEWAHIRKRLPSKSVLLEKAADPDEEDVSLTEDERALLHLVDGRRTVQDVIAEHRQGEFATLKQIFSLLTAGLVRVREQPRVKAIAEDMDDTEALWNVVQVYNVIFAFIYAEAKRLGDGEPEELKRALAQFLDQSADDPNNIFHNVHFDRSGRLDEQSLFANIAEISASERARVLDGALNDLLSYELFEMTKHLGSKEKSLLYRRIAEEKRKLARV